MKLYIKQGLISFLAGTLGAGLTYMVDSWCLGPTNCGFDVWYFSYFFQMDLASMFWRVLPFILLGGLPSMVLLTLRMIIWKKSGKPEKVMSLYCFVFGFIIGLLAYPFLLIAGV